MTSEHPGGAGLLLTLRLLMHGKEVGSIIGKKGETVKKIREESRARVNISKGSCPERIITITGHTECVYRAFSLITLKLEEDEGALVVPGSSPALQPPISLRLVLPTNQCGSLIGKGGSKVKEIRETSGAQVQVAADLLPNSTEREVTISGSPEVLLRCVKLICTIILESPPKGATVLFRPGLTVGPVLLAGTQVLETLDVATHPLFSVGQGGVDLQQTFALQGHCSTPPYEIAKLIQLQQSLNPVSQLATQHLPGSSEASSQTCIQELLIPNELIGSIIGRQGNKINEIRQVSGAQIKIGGLTEGSSERQVTISGAPLAMGVARYLITSCLEIAKSTVQPSSMPPELTMSFTPSAPPASSSSSSSSSSYFPLAAMRAALPHAALPLSSLLGMKPLRYQALSTPSTTAALGAPLSPRVTMALPSYTSKISSSASGTKKPERHKFSPY